MKLLVAYDVSDDRRRERIVRILLDYGQRIQESVFWLEAEPPLIERMRQRLRAEIDEEDDSLWIVPLCEACIRRLETLGIQNMPEVPAYYIV
jgi:CRISPR-associated protein Cas2